MRIKAGYSSNGTYTIRMDNFIIKQGLIFKSLRYNKDDDPMSRFIKVVKYFSKGEELFFGHYRTDGINLTSEEWAKYDKEIPEYFQANGRNEPLVQKIEEKGKTKTYSGYLTVGSLPLDNETYEMLPKIFHYYLETIFFCPKTDWEMFVQSYSNYMKHGTRDYVLNEYTDFLFAYVDSGDFSISFDPNVHDPKIVQEEIHKIILE